MSTNAYITFHNLPSHLITGITTATFRRHCDGYLGHLTANMFYNLFDNPQSAKGIIEAMICADPSQVEFYGLEKVSEVVCNGEYHYHLDFKTFELVVLNHEWWDETAEVKTVFTGRIDEYINQYSGEVKAVVSKHESNANLLDVFTRENMFNQMLSDLEKLKPLVKSNPANPVIKHTCKTCLLYTSPSPRDLSTSRMPSSA